MSPERPEARADVLAELARAEADEAAARAEADQAAARAERLRSTPTAEPGKRRGALPRIAVAAAGALAGAGAVLTVLMLWQHASVAAQRAHDEQIVEGARAAVTALLSIDHTRARDDVQRVLELSTGAFREDFAKSADDFVATAEKSKAVTKGTISAAALDSAAEDKGVVLVAASSQVSNSSGAREDPRPFRMSVTVTRDGGQFKMSDLEFVP